MPLIPQKREGQVHGKMKIRNRKITVRLSEKERKFLGEQADAGGMKIEPYIRELIMGNEVKSRPKEEWAEVVRQVAAVGNNINQIAVRVNSTNKVYAEDIVNIKEGQDKIWQLLNSLQSKLLRLKR